MNMKTTFKKAVMALSCRANARRGYLHFSRFLPKSSDFNREQIAEFQTEQLRKTCVSAYENVPYYQSLFREAGFDPYSLREPSELKMLPFLTKQLVQENLSDMVSRKYIKSLLHYTTTSGSTGIPLGQYITGYTTGKEQAFMEYFLYIAGCLPAGRQAILRGEKLPDGIIWIERHDDLILSSFDMSNDNIALYIELIRAKKIEMLRAFPSTAYLLAKYMLEQKIPPIDSLKVIWLASENIYPYIRATLEKAFACKIISHYGHNENLCLAFEYGYPHVYHLFWQYGYTELINEEGKDATQEGERAEIVATSFDHTAMPFIRYRTSDIAINTLWRCEAHPEYQCIARIDGRAQDTLITKNGKYISNLFNLHPAIFDNVRQYQLYQDNPAYFVMKIVKSNTYSAIDEEIIRKELYRRVGDDLGIHFEYCDEIPTTGRGKTRLIDQRLSIPFGHKDEII
jgi:phenylacetate-CoA ligase